MLLGLFAWLAIACWAGCLLKIERDHIHVLPAHPFLDVPSLPLSALALFCTLFQAVLSDGMHYVQGMLATQLNTLVHSKEIQPDSIVQVLEYMNNNVQGKTVVVVLKVRVVQSSASRIGNPVDVGTTMAAGAGMASAVGAPQPQPPLYNSTNGTGAVVGAIATHPAAYAPSSSSSTSYGGANSATIKSSSPVRSGSNFNYNANPHGSPSAGGHNPYGQNRPSSSGSGSGGGAPIVRDAAAHTPITAIANLNMYNNRWTIRARVTSKSDIRTWSNAKGEGTLFSVDLLDAQNMDVRATFFREAVDKFYPFLHVGKVYTFSGGKLKVANMQYNTCQCQFEITFDQNSEIHLDSNHDTDIRAQHYNFVPIAQLENVPEKQMVDVLAIVKRVHDPVSLVSKKTGQELIKCDVTLIDQSGTEVTLTLWGDKAKKAPTELGGGGGDASDPSNAPVVIAAFRRARVSDYGGKSLSGGDAVDVNPMHLPEAQTLATWWTNGGGAASADSARSLSASSGGGGKMDSFADRKTLSAIKDEGLGQPGFQNGTDPGKADWLSVKAHLTFLKKDKEGGAWYPACPNANEPCKNRFKVSSATDGGYSCEKCQQQYDKCVRRWIFSAVVEDDTGSNWVSFFNEQAEQLLGATADDVFRASYENGHDQDAYESVFARANFSEWVLKCKVKSELVNEEQRVKTSVYAMSPLDYVKESKDMLAEIEKF